MNAKRPDWRKHFPQNEEELMHMLRDDELIALLETHGVFVRYDKKTDKVMITKKKV